MSDLRRFLLNGEWRSSTSTFPVRFPFTGEIYTDVFKPTDTDLEEAIQVSLAGFEIMRRMPAHQRSAALRRLSELMREHTEEFVELLCLEGGKTRKVARIETARACQTVFVASEEARRIEGEWVPLDWVPDGENRMGIVKRFPIGPIFCIAPFNYPLNLACHKIAPALAAGNSIILKPASSTPLSALLLGKLALEAGIPPEAFSVLTCSGAQAEKIVRDDRIKMFSFTGSSEVGWRLKQVCGRKRYTLELGGNAAAIIHEDANLAYAAKRIASGGFMNAGQNCISVQRVLIHEPAYQKALDLIVHEVNQLKVGDPRLEDTDVGPMINEEAAQQTAEWIKEAVSEGARLLTGGSRTGALVQPTILAEVKTGMKVCQQEVFAPVITIDRYNTFDEAVELANSTDYGLQGGIFTQNINRIMQAFNQIEVGGLMVNDVSTFRVDHMPYGGVKGSGFGREGLKYAIEEMTEAKLMIINMAGGAE
jgi:acyl-CoA reductase-like NAD-dependent aldehyde dehydrogenase